MATEHSTRLARNFTQSFKPERRYLAAILRYAAAGKGGTVEAISSATGIPTGASSGKVQPTINYCMGMGLLLASKEKYGYKFFSLTPFGKAVFREDPFLSEPVIQWLAHLNLCHPRNGADLWYQIFVEGAETLGMDFSKSSVDTFLRTVYATKTQNIIGPVLQTYADEAALKKAGVLTEENNQVHRVAAPCSIESRRGLAAWLAQLLSDFFPGQRQISIVEWERVCGWKRATGWRPSTAADMLMTAEQLGVLRIDRHMDPWLVDLCISPDAAWDTIFDDMV